MAFLVRPNSPRRMGHTSKNEALGILRNLVKEAGTHPNHKNDSDGPPVSSFTWDITLGEIMYINERINNRLAAPIIGMIILIFYFSGCYSYRMFSISRIESQTKVTLFDYYFVKILGCSGYNGTDFNFNLYADYLDSLNVATPIDSLPELSIDTICFKLQCLDSSYCIPVQESTILNREIVPWHDLLFFIEYKSGIYIPLDCEAITISFTARWSDRATGEEIGREGKVLLMKVSRNRDFSLGS